MKSWDRNSQQTTVVVTGIGMITAIANNREDTWQQILKGKSGIKFDPKFQLPIARVQGLNKFPQVSRSQTRSQYLLNKAVLEAIADAQLELPLPNCGLVIGSSRSNQRELELLLENPALSSRSSIGTNCPFIADAISCTSTNGSLCNCQLVDCSSLRINSFWTM